MQRRLPADPRKKRQVGFSIAGFTLIELLVMIAIIAVLSALLFPAIGSMMQKGKSAACVSNLRQVGVGLIQYYAERPGEPLLYSGSYGNTNTNQPVWPYLLSDAGYVGLIRPVGQKVWNCPCATPTLTSYGVVQRNEPAGIFGNSIPSTSSSTSFRMINIERPSKTWLVGDVQANSNSLSGWYSVWPSQLDWTNNHAPAVGRHGGRANVCMFDGHVEALTLQEVINGKYTSPTNR